MENKQSTTSDNNTAAVKSLALPAQALLPSQLAANNGADSMRKLQEYLNKNIRFLKVQAVLTLCLTVIVGGWIFYDIKSHLTEQLTLLDHSIHPIQYLTFLIFRSSALGVIATTILLFGAKITVASFDQEVRFMKRKLGTMFLEFLYDQYKDNLKGDVTLPQLMGAFETWNKTVESAFSSVKIDKASHPVGKVADEITGKKGDGEGQKTDNAEKADKGKSET
jgi:hypothetical protein